MTEHDKLQMQKTLERYNRLVKHRDHLIAALKRMEEPALPGAGFHQASPFTGNTRETRRVNAIRFWFSPTAGGAPAMELLLDDVNLSAWTLGRALEQVLQAELAATNEGLDKL